MYKKKVVELFIILKNIKWFKFLLRELVEWIIKYLNSKIFIIIKNNYVILYLLIWKNVYDILSEKSIFI